MIDTVIDQIATITHMTGTMPVRLRVYTEPQSIVVASPATDNGHMVNYRAPWIASHAAGHMKIPKPFRFFTTYSIDAGEDRRISAIFEMTFNWIGNVALCIKGSRMVPPEEAAMLFGGELQCDPAEAADALQH